MDIGDKGLSFYIDIPVRKRQTVNITDASRSNMCKQAVVRWVRKFDNGLYKAGLMYVDWKTDPVYPYVLGRVILIDI